MESIKVNKKTINHLKVRFSFQRLLILMVAMMTAMAFIACDNAGDNEEDEGGDNGGSVSGKRIKSWVQVTERASDGVIRMEYTYNNDGSIKQIDTYNESSKRTMYSIYSNNSDGTPDKVEQFFEDNPNMKNVSEFTYNSQKTLQKMLVTLYIDGVPTAESTTDYTFVNGRKTIEVYTGSGGAVQMVRVYEYDGKGKRTITTETQTVAGSLLCTRKYTRTYNSDGTLKMVDYPYNCTDNTIVTTTFTWENGKKAVDEDIYLAY